MDLKVTASYKKILKATNIVYVKKGLSNKMTVK